jgi:DNA-binding PadR family transcriptional regulator
VYTTLQRLERDGLVQSDDAEPDGPQKGFRITTAGHNELIDWLRTPPDETVPPRDELVIKVLVALSVPGVDVEELLQVHRRHLVQTMQRYTRLKEHAAEDDVGLALVADAEIFRMEAVIRWLDAADVRLKRFPTAIQRPTLRGRPRLRPPYPRPTGPGAPGGPGGDGGPGAAPGVEGLRFWRHRGARPPLRRPGGQGRGAGGRDGPQRFGQEHAADHRRDPRGGDQRPGGRRPATWPSPPA